ncbi:hypothetical protein SAMN04487894_104158 [Niabella drilacis]|uniref:Uncharacterized protein n=1 Tax=Niabella drilacis (strain DSM 25811 / CCM 8410 / CCUG 62505 / LMG 26954 / E90) TaxID=1285928 RepID=A0A1G6PVH2_NIADE|nr:hypothetical protein SAMN04487894_104158 [Niabella drilacis]
MEGKKGVPRPGDCRIWVKNAAGDPVKHRTYFQCTPFPDRLQHSKNDQRRVVRPGFGAIGPFTSPAP